MPVNETVTLDLDAIVKQRFGDKKIPKPVLNWLKKFIHQDHLNGYLKQGWLGVEFAEQALVYYDIHLTVKGLRTSRRMDVTPSPATIRWAASTP